MQGGIRMTSTFTSSGCGGAAAARVVWHAVLTRPLYLYSGMLTRLTVAAKLTRQGAPGAALQTVGWPNACCFRGANLSMARLCVLRYITSGELGSARAFFCCQNCTPFLTSLALKVCSVRAVPSRHVPAPEHERSLPCSTPGPGPPPAPRVDEPRAAAVCHGAGSCQRRIWVPTTNQSTQYSAQCQMSRHATRRVGRVDYMAGGVDSSSHNYAPKFRYVSHRCSTYSLLNYTSSCSGTVFCPGTGYVSSSYVHACLLRARDRAQLIRPPR